MFAKWCILSGMSVSILMRLMLFVYEVIRFLGVLMSTLLVEVNVKNAADMSHFWISVCPNVRFPLMALFLLISFDRHAVYLPLFIVGKLAGVALSVCFLVKGITIASNMLSYLPITIGDTLSILVCIGIRNGIGGQRRRETHEQTMLAAGSADD